MSQATGVKTVYSLGPIVQKIESGVWIWGFILDLSEAGPQDPVERFVDYVDRRVLFIFHDYVHDRDGAEKILDAQTRSTQWMQSRLQYLQGVTEDQFYGEKQDHYDPSQVMLDLGMLDEATLHMIEQIIANPSSVTLTPHTVFLAEYVS